LRAPTNQKKNTQTMNIREGAEGKVGGGGKGLQEKSSGNLDASRNGEAERNQNKRTKKENRKKTPKKGKIPVSLDCGTLQYHNEGNQNNSPQTKKRSPHSYEEERGLVKSKQRQETFKQSVT